MINSVCGVRSTGRICTDLAQMLEAKGHQVKIAYGRMAVPEVHQKYAYRIGSDRDVKLHGLKARLWDASGFGSIAATKRFIRWVKEYDPDLIHLHNIHGYYLNVELLFQYLRSCGKPILWSFYDCWSFTGHCAHFDYNGCQKWQKGCSKCRFSQEYPKSFLDRSAANYEKKRKLFTGIPNLQLIVPSKWMAKMVSQSYMKDYPCHVLPNGIDVAQFVASDGDVREKYGIGEKSLVLGVSSVWQKMKGLTHINDLAQKLPKEKYAILLVGGGEDKEPIDPSILRVHHTDSIDALCRIYTAADVFINPTLQETQGLTTVEAFACGTPAVVFNAGGAAECVDDTCGIIVPKDDTNALQAAIEKVCREKPFKAEACRKKAEAYDKNVCYQAFMALYDELCSQ